MTSKAIEDFLAFLREAEQEHNIAAADEKETDDATQDILHAVEFGTYNHRKTASLAKKLREVRRKRRQAKETVEISAPVIEWLQENGNTVKSLERLLGEVRKAERRVQGRVYSPRTNIMEEPNKEEQ